MLIVLSVRRFRCPVPSCPKATFAEQAEGVSERYRRRSVPLLGMLAGFGLELAGRAATRLAGTLGVPVHSSTVLRLVMALPDPPVAAAPEVTGVDDFALRKGRVYGTVIADAEWGRSWTCCPTGRPPPGSKAEGPSGAVSPGTGPGPAEGAQAGAPCAVQVADRWHLWHNLGEYVEKAVVAHRGCLTDAPDGPAAGDGEAPPGQLPGCPARPRPLHASRTGWDVCGRERVLVFAHPRAPRRRARAAAGRALPAGGRRDPRAWTEDGKPVRQPGRPRRAAGQGHRPGRQAGPVQALDRPAAGTRASPAPPPCTPRWPPSRAGPAASRPSSATSASSATQTGRQGKAGDPGRPQAAPPARRPAKSPARLLTRPDHLDPDDQARLAAVRASCRTWTPSPATSGASPR